MEVDQRATALCIACQGIAHEIGEVPYAYHFLQHHFTTPLDSGNLYECRDCGLWFKSPYLSAEQVADFYRDSPDSLSWESGEDRSDFACAISAINRALPQGGKVLDFGCYTGGFLRQLPEQFLRHGIEPSVTAGEAAAAHKIKIVGRDTSALKGQQFDCITLFDVFEHLIEPLRTLDTLFAHIRPGGLLCIGTGFADSPAFHLSGPKYNYVCMPEHSCFLTRRFLAFLSDRFKSEYEFSIISRIRPGLHWILCAAAINSLNSPMLLLKSKKTIFRWYPSHRLRVLTSRGILPLFDVGDHAVVVFKKAEALT
jgi:SAM-dependent methyltransferase